VTSPFDLFTIGHSSHPIERFLALLAAPGVTGVVDVRSRPFSRRFPWFSQTRLAQHLQGQSIAYLPRGDALGGRPDDPALLRDGIADYEAIAATRHFQSGLDEISALSKHGRPCLMCAEREPLDCHRFLLVARALADRGLRVAHLLADGSIEPHAATEDRLLAAIGADVDLFSVNRAARLADAYRRRAGAVAFRT